MAKWVATKYSNCVKDDHMGYGKRKRNRTRGGLHHLNECRVVCRAHNQASPDYLGRILTKI